MSAFHGGQEWQTLPGFVEDLSVTTNGFGPPPSALSAARQSVADCHHYPPLNGEPHLSHLAAFLWGTSAATAGKRLLLGNGASELIDLLTREAAASAQAAGRPLGWSPGPSATQYKEYERSARTAGFVDALTAADASLVCIVNPCNPTGDYKPRAEMMAWIEAKCVDEEAQQASGGVRAHVLIDESMLMWLGPRWQHDSLASQHSWLMRMAERGVLVFVLHSWTKIWACPGLRLGSCVCPTLAAAERIRARQIPWSVNLPALSFLSAAIRDEAYLHTTWQLTPLWNRAARDALHAAFPQWRVRGPLWTSWLWVDTGEEATLQRALVLAREAGLPIRSGAAGYGHPTCFRMAVRSPEVTRALVAALRKTKSKL